MDSLNDSPTLNPVECEFLKQNEKRERVDSTLSDTSDGEDWYPSIYEI